MSSVVGCEHPILRRRAFNHLVRAAYGMKAKADPLAFLLDLNHQLAAAEKAGTAIVGPGLPPCVTEPGEFITTDCVQPPTRS